VDREKRKSDTSIPANLEEILNEAQQQALPGIKYLGWEPRFLRKPMFQAPELVMQNSSDSRTGILDVVGRIRIQNIKIREHEQLKASESGSTAATESNPMPAGSAAHDKELASLRADNEKLLAEIKESQFAEARLTEQIEQQRGELCESAEKLSSLYAQVQSDTVEMQLLQDQYAALQEQYADVVEAHKLEIEQLYKQPSSRPTSRC
jgi:hypothetical protein